MIAADFMYLLSKLEVDELLFVRDPIPDGTFKDPMTGRQQKVTHWVLPPLYEDILTKGRVRTAKLHLAPRK